MIISLHYSHNKMMRYSKQYGFSLIEVLITVVVTSFGLLGIAGLQMSSINASTHASVNTSAMISIDEIVGRIHANPTAAKNGEFDIDPDANNTLIAVKDMTAPNSSASLAEQATYYWFQNMDASIPGVRAGIHCTSGGRCVVKVKLPVKSSQNDNNNMSQVVSFQL